MRATERKMSVWRMETCDDLLSSGNKTHFHVNYSKRISLYLPPTWSPCHVVANQEYHPKYFSNTLIIHQENTKEIKIEWVFGNQMKNCSFCILKFLPLKSCCWRSNIKHSTQCFKTRWNTSKLVKNTPLRVVFSTLFSVLHRVMNHWLLCLIYYMKYY